MKKIIIIFILVLVFPNIVYALNTANFKKNHNIHCKLKIKMIFLHLNKKYKYGISWNNAYYHKPILLKKYGTIKIKNFSIKISKKPIYSISEMQTYKYAVPESDSNGELTIFYKHYLSGIHIVIAVSAIKNGLFYNGYIVKQKLIKFNHYKFDYRTFNLPILNRVDFPIEGRVFYNNFSFAGEYGYRRNIFFVLVKLIK